MLSKATIKLIRSLKQKKYRQQEQLFVAEGSKIALEVLQQAPEWISACYASADWLAENATEIKPVQQLCEAASDKDLDRISQLKNHAQVLLLLKTPDYSQRALGLSQNISLALDGIRDPGNLGTLLRIADWFGIRNVFCAEDCVDWTNSKVVQASMGSFLRVRCHYKNLAELFKEQQLPVVGASMQGQALKQVELPPAGFLLIGSESHGIRPELQEAISIALHIPRLGGAESLNAAVATGILCAEWCLPR